MILSHKSLPITLVNCNIFLLLFPKTSYINPALHFPIWVEKGIYVSNLPAQLDCKALNGRGFYVSLHHKLLESILNVLSMHLPIQSTGTI